MFKAAGLGLEPRWLVPETRILPLDDPAALKTKRQKINVAYILPDFLKVSSLAIKKMSKFCILFSLAILRHTPFTHTVTIIWIV